VRAVPPDDVAVIVNTGDDMRFYGVHVSPDVDIVTYTLAGIVDRARGYGLEGDTTAVIEALGALGHETVVPARRSRLRALPPPHAASRSRGWGSV
jgi:LPPG:FO 2-phospho-L-lactate transferase